MGGGQESVEFGRWVVLVGRWRLMNGWEVGEWVGGW